MSTIAKNEFGFVTQLQISQDIFELEIKHNKTNARLSLYGGQVLSWQPSGEKEVFWLSKNSAFEEGKAIRGGIPLCWPWFGCHPNDSDNKSGNHGFARGQIWQVESIDISELGVEVNLSWQGKNMNDLVAIFLSTQAGVVFWKVF